MVVAMLHVGWMQGFSNDLYGTVLVIVCMNMVFVCMQWYEWIENTSYYIKEI